MLGIQLFQIPVSLPGLNRQKVWSYLILGTDGIYCPEDRSDLPTELLGFFRPNPGLQLLAHQAGSPHQPLDPDHLPAPGNSRFISLHFWETRHLRRGVPPTLY